MTDTSDPPTRSAAYRIARAVGRFLVGILVVGYSILDTLLFPVFRPLIRWLSGVRLFEAIGALIVRLPPYVVLLILAVPFVVLEPLKVFALYWFALGHLIQGGALLIVAHGLSILTLERLYHAGKPQLMQIGWFARIMGWLGGLRDRALEIARSTAAWQWSARVAADLRAWFRGLIQPAR
jgi:hypothetical protein